MILKEIFSENPYIRELFLSFSLYLHFIQLLGLLEEKNQASKIEI